ncbi:MAG: hypothetical protein LBP53_03535 [Candidatus Peribacteria bacterium]|jgi:hypothetical protein|nr:hypothetical protein [Candidatus Peribacteria bacterium]
MQLFKRLLLSYFPDTLVQHSLNPASMFVSFISSKDFFAIINRKIVENYKLNLFDLALDTFEFKIGLGEKGEGNASKISDIYYGYLSAANFNGYKFYNVANTSNALVLAVSLYLQDIFTADEEDKSSRINHQLFVDCLYAFYLLSFLFVARVKVFPGKSDQEDFNWFVELFFDFYGAVLVQLKHKISKEQFANLRKKLITKLEVFFLMFYFYRRINQFFAYHSNEEAYFAWLFGEHLSPIQKNFLATYTHSKYTSQISLAEEEILFDVAPADIHLKYLFLDNDTQELVTHLISSVYDKKILDKKLANLMKNPAELDFILDYLTDPTNFKKGYLHGMQKYFMSLFRDDDEEMEEFNEMMSVIGDDMEQFDHLKIPQRVKRESKLMEQLLNFYITYVGGLSIERADTFFLRFYKPQMIRQLLELLEVQRSTPVSLQWYGLQQFFYSKNAYFYAYVHTNVRSGKEKFLVPMMSTTQTIRSNVFSLTMFDEIALITLLQDLNPKICKLYIKNKSLLDWFQTTYAAQISPLMKKSPVAFIQAFYQPLLSVLDQGEAMISVLQTALQPQDLIRLKDALYSFDLRLFRSFLEKLHLKKIKKLYTDQALLNICAVARELLPGFLLLYHFILAEDSKQKTSTHPEHLLKLFLEEVLGIDTSLFSLLNEEIAVLLEEF